MEKNVPNELKQEALLLLNKELSDPANCEGEKLVAIYKKDKTPEVEMRIKRWTFSFISAMLLPEPENVVKVFKENKFLKSKEDENFMLDWLTKLRKVNSLKGLQKEELEVSW